MSISIENWYPSEDKFLKQGEIDLHQFLHSERSKKIVSADEILTIKSFRWNFLRGAIDKFGGVSGRSLEVGAGDGWCSAAVLANYPLEEATIVEIDDAAVRELIPSTLHAFGVLERKIVVAKGSFNNIPKHDYFDVAFAMGALHHSSNLYMTFKSIFRSLRPGGVLFSQEPAMNDTTSNDYYEKREKETTTFIEGVEVINSARSDTFYRECEYRTAALHAGFDVDVERVNQTAESNRKRFGLFPFGLFPKAKSKCDQESNNKPFNVFITATKPAQESEREPLTAWESVD